MHSEARKDMIRLDKTKLSEWEESRRALKHANREVATLLSLWALYAVLFWGVVGYVAFHFIQKFW
jgi:hypothetical protein